MANEFYTTFGSGEPNSCIVFHDGNEPPTLAANTVTLWAEDVGSAGHELKVKDENGNITILSSNVEAYPDDMAVSDTYPHVTLLQNEFIGVGTYISTIRQAELVQELAKKEGLLKVDEFIVKHVDIPKKDWAAAEQWRHEQRNEEIEKAINYSAKLSVDLVDAMATQDYLKANIIQPPDGNEPNDPNGTAVWKEQFKCHEQYVQKLKEAKCLIDGLKIEQSNMKIPRTYVIRSKPAWLKDDKDGE